MIEVTRSLFSLDKQKGIHMSIRCYVFWLCIWLLLNISSAIASEPQLTKEIVGVGLPAVKVTVGRVPQGGSLAPMLNRDWQVPNADIESEVLEELGSSGGKVRANFDWSTTSAHKATDTATASPSPFPELQFDAFTPAGAVGDLDTDGAVGPKHVVTMRNTGVWVRSRTGLLIASTSLYSFWSSVLPAGAGGFDPQVLYDPASDRYFATLVMGGYDGAVLFGYSLTNKPNGAWKQFRIVRGSGGAFSYDRATLGVSGDLVAITANVYRSPLSPPTAVGGFTLFALRKAALSLSRSQPAVTAFDLGGGYVGRVSSASAGGNDAIYLVSPYEPFSANPQIQISKLETAGSGYLFTPQWKRIPVLLPLTVPTVANQQLGSIALLTSCQGYQLFNFPGQLLVVYSGYAPFGATWVSALGWFQYDLANDVVAGSGTIQDGAAGRSFLCPSLAATSSAAIIGFSTASPTSYQSGGYVVRDSNPASQFRTPMIYAPGLFPRTPFFANQAVRVGDYSATVIDTVESCRFWTAQEYENQPGDSTVAWAKVNACSP